MPIIDLHCHTTASDGLVSPADLVRHAADRGVDVIAITDHDTVAGVAEGLRTAAEVSVRVLPGIEMSTRHDSRDVHILGYFVDHTSSELLTELDGMRMQREQRAERIIERLRELGYEITDADVREQAAGAVIARPHVARALVAKGLLPSVRSAFTSDLIGDGGRAYVSRDVPSSIEAIEMIRRAGGVAVVAHPGVGHHEGEVKPMSSEAIGELAEAGLVGLEVDHPDHPPLIRDRLNAIAHEHGLVVTGGSDWHGLEHTIGGWTTTAESLECLEALARGGATAGG